MKYNIYIYVKRLLIIQFQKNHPILNLFLSYSLKYNFLSRYCKIVNLHYKDNITLN